ncbi:MAG: hypothetical protein ACRDFS_08125 [Chloroflexota bacterium]
MITVLTRLRVENWDQFRHVHDEPRHMKLRRERGNVTHHVLSQLDDVTDVVFLDTWGSPQDANRYYFSDDFERSLDEMNAALVELIKLEDTQAASLEGEPGPA